MAQKYTDASSGTAGDRFGVNAQYQVKHLSDGTAVWLANDPSGTHFLKWSSDHVTVNTLASTTTLAASWGFGTTPGLVVDASDNIYLVGKGLVNGGWNVKAWTKGAGYTWTAQANVATGALGTDSNSGHYELEWCNIGGTGGHGIIFAASGNPTLPGYQYATFDAGVALAGSGTVNLSNGNFISTGSNGVAGPNLSIAQDGFGAASGIAVGGGALSNQASVSSWSVNSSGVVTQTAISANVTVGTMGSLTRSRCVRLSSNLWAVIVPSTTAGRYMVARFSSTALLTTYTDSGAPTNLPLNGGNLDWDVFADPLTAGQLWLLAGGTVASGQKQIWRVVLALGSGITWPGAATAEDLLTNANAAPAQPDMRCVKQPRGTIVDWQVNLQIAATPTYALVGDYTAFASAPNAPTLTAPANGLLLDVAATPPTFQSTYNSTDGTNENAYALRQKVSGAGSYNYWTGTAWQSTIIWPAVSVAPAGTTSVGPISTGLSDGNVYNWSMASQEAGASLQGPFASDFSFTAQAAPTVVANGPTGSVTTTNQPTVSWTTTPAAGAAQTAYRVVVETGSYGTVPGSGTQLYDSGTIAGSAQSKQVTATLPNGATCRAFVQVTETGGVTSSWASVTFTISLDLPQTPTVTAVAGTDPTTGAPRIAITVQGQDNALTTTQASFEDGTTTGWAAGASTAIANTTAQALDGTHSMSLTRQTTTGAASASTPTGTSGIPVTPGKPWQALANFRSAVTARSCTVQVLWYQASGAASAIRASDTSAGVNDTTTGFTQAALAVNSPADAAFAAVVVSVAGAVANEVHYVDNVDLGPGSSAVWTRGGLVGSTTVTVLRSDGTYVRGAGWAAGTSTAVPGPGQAATVFDYEVAVGTPYTYQAVVGAVLSGATISSPLSAASGPATATSTNSKWWIFDPTNTAGAVGFDTNADIAWKWPLRSSMHFPFGKGKGVKFSDGVKGKGGTLPLVETTQAQITALETLFATDAVYCLISPGGETRYINTDGDIAETAAHSVVASPMTLGSTFRMNTWQVGFYEADRP